jgi:hypothetical protein
VNQRFHRSVIELSLMRSEGLGMGDLLDPDAPG